MSPPPPGTSSPLSTWRTNILSGNCNLSDKCIARDIQKALKETRGRPPNACVRIIQLVTLGYKKLACQTKWLLNEWMWLNRYMNRIAVILTSHGEMADCKTPIIFFMS